MHQRIQVQILNPSPIKQLVSITHLELRDPLQIQSNTSSSWLAAPQQLSLKQQQILNQEATRLTNITRMYPSWISKATAEMQRRICTYIRHSLTNLHWNNLLMSLDKQRLNNDQCVCLTNSIWCSTSNPKCHVTFSKTKWNINWHLHFLLKYHLNITCLVARVTSNF